MWFVYTALLVNLFIIWQMPKRLTRREIYATWAVIAILNLSTDVILSLHFRLYELGPPGVQLSVHFIELTLGASHAILFLNYMPQRVGRFVWYLIGWVAYSVLFELVTLYVGFIIYTGWKLWYSAVVYVLVFLFLRWHFHYIRSGSREKRTL